MAAKSIRTAARRRQARKEPADGSITVLVRRGASRRFDALTRKLIDLPVVVSWDRRRGDRRTSSTVTSRDRRQTDRREAPPFTWELADFVVAASEKDHPAKRSPAKRRAAKAASRGKARRK